ncbi:hypothetical protein MRX96_055230 [Rhipicephalus microplus]
MSSLSVIRPAGATAEGNHSDGAAGCCPMRASLLPSGCGSGAACACRAGWPSLCGSPATTRGYVRRGADDFFLASRWKCSVAPSVSRPQTQSHPLVRPATHRCEG